MTDKLVNGRILDAASKKLTEALNQKRLAKRDRIQYEILDLIVMYIAEDHPKTRQMWGVYRPMAWVMLVVGGALLTAVVTGKILISYVK